MPDYLPSTTKKSVTLAEIERVARMYRTNTESHRALGISITTFLKLCRMQKVETPAQRRKRIRTRTLQGERCKLGSIFTSTYGFP